MILRSYQSQAGENVMAEFQNVNSTLVVLPTGCHDPNQPILMSNGTIKKAKEIAVGDTLIGPDNGIRNVLKIHTGESSLKRIIPTKGDSFTVTHDHVLTLIRTNLKSKPIFECQKNQYAYVDVKVSEWEKWPKWRKHTHKLIRAGVDFNNYFKSIPISSYVLGLLLGDGSFRINMSITTEEKSIVQAINYEFLKFGMYLKKSKSKCGNADCWLFRSIQKYDRSRTKFMKNILKPMFLDNSLSGNKSIPIEYKTSPKQERLEILAGLIDTDGHNSDNCFDYVSKSKILADDVAFIARSLGLAAYVKKTWKNCQTGNGNYYWRVTISGDTSIIPCRIKRKKTTIRKQKKSALRTGFTVENAGYGEYFGFSVDGDNRYLMGDFTVTHNCGKTILFADIVRRFFPRRALVLAHREELIFQAKDKIERVTGLTCAVEMADYRVNDHDMFHGAASVVVSSIQTQCSGGDGGGRMTKFDPAGFGLIVIDEAHHATAGSYKRIIEYYRNNPNVKILGVTATPDRADEEALGQIYETVAFDYEILDAINDGWLVPIQQQIVSVGALDFSQVRTTAGDLNGGDLAEIMEAEECLHSIATPTMEIIGTRRTLVFASSVKHAERLAEIFNRHQEGCAAWVCGKTPKDERRKILADFAAGRIQIVVNCAVLTEGFDDSGVEVIVMGKPTKSRSLYCQCVGRATRPLPGTVDGPETAELRKLSIENSAKPSCLIIDFVGNSGRHKLMTSADILGGKCSDEALKKAVDKITKSKKAMSMTDALAESEEEIKAEKRKKELLESAKRIRLKAAASFRTQNVNPFDVLQLSPAKDRGWDSGKHLSNKQVELLAKNGIADADKMPYGQAKQLLNEMFRRWDGNLCSFKQAKILAKNGLPVDVSREVATKTIDAIVANGWKVPANINDVINQRESDHVPF